MQIQDINCFWLLQYRSLVKDVYKAGENTSNSEARKDSYHFCATATDYSPRYLQK